MSLAYFVGISLILEAKFAFFNTSMAFGDTSSVISLMWLVRDSWGLSACQRRGLPIGLSEGPFRLIHERWPVPSADPAVRPPLQSYMPIVRSGGRVGYALGSDSLSKGFMFHFVLLHLIKLTSS